MQNIVLFLLAICLILAGTMMMDTRQDAQLTDALAGLARGTGERFNQVDERIDNLDRKVDMMLYGQQLLSGN